MTFWQITVSAIWFILVVGCAVLLLQAAANYCALTLDWIRKKQDRE